MKKNIGTRRQSEQYKRCTTENMFMTKNVSNRPRLRSHRILKNHCPAVASSSYTKAEQKMDEIQREKQEKTCSAKHQILKPVTVPPEKKTIGAANLHHEKQTGERTIGKYPTCTVKLVILRSRKTGKRFVGCQATSRATARPLFLQRGFVKPSGDCKSCGWPPGLDKEATPLELVLQLWVSRKKQSVKL
jgi:hypothetical protein